MDLNHILLIIDEFCHYNLMPCPIAKCAKSKEIVKYLFIQKKKKRVYGKRVIPIASIIDCIPNITIATPPNISM